MERGITEEDGKNTDGASIIDEFARRLMEYKWSENGVTEIIKARKVTEVAELLKRELNENNPKQY